LGSFGNTDREDKLPPYDDRFKNLPFHNGSFKNAVVKPYYVHL